MSKTEKYELVVGLEVHAQLQTNSKLFCGDHADFSGMPNTHVSAITLAHPGTLPKINSKAIELAVKLGTALGCTIDTHHYFARKNYFYPDLPKGYQISQHTHPICKKGFVYITMPSGNKQIQLNRMHLEEDAGKSLHELDEKYTSIDYNRAGVPLLEIVTEAVMHSSEEAFAFLTELRKLIRWLDVCDGNMEEGSMRCDANISIRLKGESKLGNRVEVKNLNSIRNVKKAIEIEKARLIELIENNLPVIQETRSFDADNQTTFSLRSKENSDDYRYFPDPDLPMFVISDEYLASIKESMPILPDDLKEKYMADYHLSLYDATQLTIDKETVQFFEKMLQETNHIKAIANWITGPIKYYCNENKLSLTDFPLSCHAIASLIDLTETGQVNFSNASAKILLTMISAPNASAIDTAKVLNLLQEKDQDALEQWINEVIEMLPEKVKEFQSGKKGLIGLFLGEIKKRSKGKADMESANRILLEKLNI